MIRHVLKDGTAVDDITGHVIKAAEFTVLYEIINRIEQKKVVMNYEPVSTPD